MSSITIDISVYYVDIDFTIRTCFVVLFVAKTVRSG